MEPPTYIRKWEELQRAYARIAHYYDGLFDPQDSFHGPKDIVRNFFRVGYELKEATKKTANEGLLDGHRGAVEEFVSQNRIIALGLDIANTEKHVTLRNKKSHHIIGAMNTHLYILDPDNHARTELTINIDGTPADCLALATEYMETWRHFLTVHSLI